MFLRWSFLYDLIALESLSEIYVQSIQEAIEKLRHQSSIEVSYSFEEQEPEIIADNNSDYERPKANILT